MRLFILPSRTARCTVCVAGQSTQSISVPKEPALADSHYLLSCLLRLYRLLDLLPIVRDYSGVVCSHR